MHVLRRVLRREVLAIYVMIFMADIVIGILASTFSLYASGLGASLALIGALGSASGLTQLFSTMPIGMLSDHTGRKRVLILGMLCFVAATVLYAIAPNSRWLLPGRLFEGLAGVATITMGVAYIGDVVQPEESGLAYGLYTTCMGVGFAVGPLLGTAAAACYGVTGSYFFASAMALMGALVAAWGLVSVIPAQGTPRRSSRLTRSAIGTLFHNPALLTASLANLVFSTVFVGAVVNFLPQHAKLLGASSAAINSMFSIRALCSAAPRLPTGYIASRVPSHYIMILALVLAMLAMLFMGQTTSLAVLTLLLGVEGLSLGMFLPAGQVFVVQNSTTETRGSAVGIYSTAGCLSMALAPLLLGLVANQWSIAAVFRITALALVLGLLTVGYFYSRYVPKGARAAHAPIVAGEQR